jgi:hypothetical protein
MRLQLYRLQLLDRTRFHHLAWAAGLAPRPMTTPVRGWPSGSGGSSINSPIVLMQEFL